MIGVLVAAVMRATTRLVAPEDWCFLNLEALTDLLAFQFLECSIQADPMSSSKGSYFASQVPVNAFSLRQVAR